MQPVTPPITIEEVIIELKRENSMRRRVYPKARIESQVAERRIAILEFAIEFFEVHQVIEGDLQTELFFDEPEDISDTL